MPKPTTQSMAKVKRMENKQQERAAKELEFNEAIKQLPDWMGKRITAALIVYDIVKRSETDRELIRDLQEHNDKISEQKYLERISK
jgi:hypothetical protein